MTFIVRIRVINLKTWIYAREEHKSSQKIYILK